MSKKAARFGAHQIIFYFLIVFTGIIILRNAWVGDDSYIGFRTVYNLVHGYGLTFNINERVQSFTNPLWIMLMSFLYLFTGEAYFTSIILSLLITLFLLYYLTIKFSDGILLTIIIFGLAISSKAFIDYSTSGLENPLGHLFIVLFAVIYFSEERNERKLFLLFFIASLATVNRLDNILLYFAPLFVQLKEFTKRKFLILLAGLVPLILWESFAIIYFGFPFPNTYYAKLSAGIPASEYFAQGFKYLNNSLALDPITLLVIATALIIAIVFAFRKKNNKIFPLAISILLYLFYTVKVGGDFMSGRFFTYPFLLSIIIFTQVEMSSIIKRIFICIIVLTTILSPYAPVKSNSTYRRNEATYSKLVTHGGVADERAWYFPNTGLINLNDTFYMTQVVEKKLDTIKTHQDSIISFIEAPIVLGFWSYSEGPNTYMFHFLGLSDPLIARLPRDEDQESTWRIGHIERKIPEGYEQTIKSGINVMTDKNLAMFYEKMQIIIKGKIFNWQRFVTIYKMNTGQYDFLINKKFYASVKNR